MRTERRQRLRRAVCGGIVIGVGAALGLALIEAGWVLGSSGNAFDGALERARFVLYLVALCAFGGVVLGAAGGALHALFERVAELRPRSRQSIWMARLWTFAATPAVAAATALALQGRRAQLLPHRRLIALTVGMALLLLLYALLRALFAVAARIRDRPGGAAAALLAAAAGGGLYAVDQRVLPRLYGFFHVGLGAACFGLLTAALLALHLEAQRRGRRIGRLAEPQLALAVALLALAGSAFALRRLGHDDAVRAIVYRRTCVAAELLDASRVILRARGPAPVDGGAVDATRAAPLPPGPTLPDRDVFLITVDAMRADRLAPRTAPRLSRLAASGVRFEHAYAQVPHTSFSLATLLTGKYVYALTALGEDAGRHETLADVFQRDRYKTAAFFPPSVFFIDHDRFADVERSAYHFEYVKYEHLGAVGRTDQVIDFLEAERPPRAFVWVHYFEPHEPYDLHPGVQPDGHPPTTAIERYDGEVAFVDGEIGRLLDYLARTRPQAVIAIAADHGEEFGEHGGRYHGTTLYEEQVHVPLVIAAPGLAPRTIGEPVGLIDVAPTLLALVGITPSARMRGQDLGPLFGSRACPPPGCEARSSPVFAEIGAQKLVASDDDRLICDLARDLCELYDLRADPGEQRSLAVKEPERAARLRARLQAHLDEPSQYERPPERDGASERARRALERGRLGDRSAAREVAALLDGDSVPLRDAAAGVLLALPPDPTLREVVDRARGARPADLALRTLALRLGERALAPSLIEAAEQPRADPALVAEIAIAVADPDGLAALGEGRVIALLARALDAAEEAQREELAKRLIAALGATRRAAATTPLLAHLGEVRTRLEIVRALGALGPRAGAAAVRPLAESLPGERYVPVRAETARVLGVLGDRSAVPSLARAFAAEREPLVAGEEAVALVRLGAAGAAHGCDLARRPTADDRPSALPISVGARDTLWLVAADGASGALELAAGAAPTRVDLAGDHRAYAVTIPASVKRATSPTVRTIAGAPHLHGAVVQRAPAP